MTSKKNYILKGIGAPEYYLGGNVDQLDAAWQRKGVFTALSALTCIANIHEKLQQMTGRDFPIRHDSPMSEAYHPELDETPMLSPSESLMYRAFIGSGNWVITLG